MIAPTANPRGRVLASLRTAPLLVVAGLTMLLAMLLVTGCGGEDDPVEAMDPPDRLVVGVTDREKDISEV